MNPSLRILFVGAVDFSRHCLEVTLGAGGDVVAVLTPSPEHARVNADYADLAPVAEEHGVPLHRIGRVNDPATVASIREAAPDVIFVFGFSQLIDSDILRIPRLGVIGSHPTLLPQGRGRHPLIWALVKGLTRSGLTFFHMDEGADTGDVLWQRPFSIALEDDAASLYEKIKVLAAEAIPEFLSQLAAGNAPRIPQDGTHASVWPKRGDRDGEIDWACPSLDIYNLIRALTRPYVGAHTFAGESRLAVWRSRLSDTAPAQPANRVAPGTILNRTRTGILVQTGDGQIELTECGNSGMGVLKNGMRLGRLTS